LAIEQERPVETDSSRDARSGFGGADDHENEAVDDMKFCNIFFYWAILLACGGFQGFRLKAELPSGFEQTVFVDHLHDPNAMEFAPDGRLFVSERISGRLRIVKDGQLLKEPFVTVTVPPEKPGKREEAARPDFRYQGIYHYGAYRSSGLRGIAFDPEFERNGYIYLHYMNDLPRVNRVSRFTASRANPNIAEPGSEKVLIDIPMHARNTGEPVPEGGSHNGGAILFGPDGKLYVSVGDGWNPAPSDAPQDLSNLIGKMLRINRDGSAPEDNPFRDVPGARPEIWALGFRNPYTMALHPRTGAIYVNDVVWGKETVYELVRGGNYRHPSFQGKGAEQSPMHAGGGLIGGGTWYFGNQFPESYRGSYFLTDWRGNVIRRIISEQEPRVVPFAVGVPRPTYIKQGPDDALYWLSANYETMRGTVYRISWSRVSEESAGAPTAIKDFDPDEGLSGHWPLDDGSGELARDISGAGRHGRIKGHTVWSSPGEWPRRLVFGPTGGNVDLGSLDLDSAPFTLSAWIKPDSFLPGLADNRIISKASGISEPEHWWMLGSARTGDAVRLRFRLKAGGRTSTLIAYAGELAPGAWSHVAAAYDGRTIGLFQDGEQVGIMAIEGKPDRNPNVAAWLGDNPPQAGSRPFHGAIRDVRIYKRALAGGELFALMQETKPQRRSGEDRAEVLAAYRPALDLAGDPEVGRLIFSERCVICHRPERADYPEIAPDLTSIVSKGNAWLLEAILDPNRDIPPEYWNYSVLTDDAMFQGFVVEETDTHITLRTLDGQNQILERSSIRSFGRQEQSMMPEGLEVGLTPEDMAGLLEYLTEMKQ
jgi:putative heme-binding domain-containing protein